MFYCDPCALGFGYPRTLSRSFGKCEICGAEATCNDRAASLLPPPQRTTAEIAREAIELSKVAIGDMEKLRQMLRLLVAGWKARDFLDGHKKNLCAQCAMAGIASMSRGITVEMAMEMMCPEVKKAVADVHHAQDAVKWFEL